LMRDTFSVVSTELAVLDPKPVEAKKIMPGRFSPAIGTLTSPITTRFAFQYTSRGLLGIDLSGS
jgi:hypothetical protein